MNDSSYNFILNISNSYSSIHGWLSTIICLIGIPFNLFIIIVLTKTKIASFTINLILICMAICDSITMIVYLPYCIHYYLIYSNSYLVEPFPERDTFFWTLYSIVYIFVSITFHSVSIWLTVYLAFYRYFSLQNSVSRIGSKNKTNLKYKQNKFIEFLLKKSRHTVVFILISCILYCSPTFFYPTVRLINNSTSSNQSVYMVDQSDLNKQTNGLMFKMSFYGQALFAKIIP